MTPLLNNRGFSLLEVLVAFSIMAMASGVIYQIYAKGTAAAILGKEYTEAVIIAESQMASLEIETGLADRTVSGISEGKYAWRMTIRDQGKHANDPPAATPPLALKEIEFEVAWESLGRQRSFNIYTLRPATIQP